MFNFEEIFTRITPSEVAKMCKYEIDLVSIVEDTERTLSCPQTDRWTDGRTDGQGETSKTPSTSLSRGFKKQWLIQINYICYDLHCVSVMWNVNSLWPGHAIWQHKSGSTLDQVMACCLTAPSHYLNQCWLIIKGGPVAFSWEQFHWKCSRYQLVKRVWNYNFEIISTFPRGQWVKSCFRMSCFHGTGKNVGIFNPHKGWCGYENRIIWSIRCFWIAPAIYIRADSRFVPSQWETSLQSNTYSHWLTVNLESALYIEAMTNDYHIADHIFISLTHPLVPPLDKMAVISQTLFSDAFFCEWNVLYFYWDFTEVWS